MIYLQEAGLSKVASGETTVDEIIRVTSPAKTEPGTESRSAADPAA
jgi:hypothetical protein